MPGIGIGKGVWRSGAPALGVNLLVNPRSFNLAPWTTGGGGATITADAGIGPDGLSQADRLDDPAIDASRRRQQPVTVVTNGIYDASIALKMETSRFAALEIFEGTRRAVIDLQTGAVLSQSMTFAYANALPNGYWLLSSRFQSSGTTATFRIYPAFASSLSLTPDITATGSILADFASLVAAA